MASTSFKVSVQDQHRYGRKELKLVCISYSWLFSSHPMTDHKNMFLRVMSIMVYAKALDSRDQTGVALHGPYITMNAHDSVPEVLRSID